MKEEPELDKGIERSPPLDEPKTASSGCTNKDPLEATDHTDTLGDFRLLYQDDVAIHQQVVVVKMCHHCSYHDQRRYKYTRLII